MVPADLSPELDILLVDIGLFTLAGAGYFALRGLRPQRVTDFRTAFEMLERSILKFFPDMPAGYTWGEAFKRLRESGVEADWGMMRERLGDYEAYRYGGREAPGQGQDDVVSLALKVRRGAIGKRTKG